MGVIVFTMRNLPVTKVGHSLFGILNGVLIVHVENVLNFHTSSKFAVLDGAVGPIIDW